MLSAEVKKSDLRHQFLANKQSEYFINCFAECGCNSDVSDICLERGLEQVFPVLNKNKYVLLKALYLANFREKTNLVLAFEYKLAP